MSNPKAAHIVDSLLREYMKVFPGRYWNVGGDEYQALTVKSPETSFPQLAALARKKYGSKATVQDLAVAWLNDRAKVISKAGRTPQAWNDGFFRGGVVKADPSLQVEYWTGKEFGVRPPAEYLSAGRRMVNLNDEYLYYVLGQPNDFTYPTGKRIYEQWTPRVVRGTAAVPAKYAHLIEGGGFAVWGDFPNAQTPAQVAAGIRMPLAATAQKLWSADKPKLTWGQFSALAAKLDRPVH